MKRGTFKNKPRKLLRKRGKSPESKLQKKCDKLLQQIYTKKYPKCDICGKPTYTMHHFVEKSRSNRLRYEPENLIPVCKLCHYYIHNRTGMFGLNNINRSYDCVDRIIQKRGGKAWKDRMETIGRETIKTNLAYYEKIYQSLTNPS